MNRDGNMMEWNARREAIALRNALSLATAESRLVALEVVLQAAYNAGVELGISQHAHPVAPPDDVARWHDMGYRREFWSQGAAPIVQSAVGKEGQK
jgi:hypothetical protein